ncbi:MAG TPA: pyridoxamine 5'-phosphate oxidase family protein [Candidatus Saccharimonadia bacterium]|nr:pyridoxamine 5'-phosphate oxidase family protein [Candidatus Saccharimonadia bacterium]
MDLQKLAQEYFDAVKPMQLATIHDGQPWICTVYFAADEAFNLYWMSARDRQHSQEIAKNSRAAVAVVKDAEKKQALQIVGEAREVSNEELENAHALYTAKYGPKDYSLEEIKKRLPQGRAYWVFKPTKMFFWDEVNFPDAPKQEVPLF